MTIKVTLSNGEVRKFLPDESRHRFSRQGSGRVVATRAKFLLPGDRMQLGERWHWIAKVEEIPGDLTTFGELRS